jgi:hypothetical protein
MMEACASAALLSVTSEIEDVGPAKDSGAGCIITATTSKGYVIAGRYLVVYVGGYAHAELEIVSLVFLRTGSALLEFKQAPQDAGVAAATDLLQNIGASVRNCKLKRRSTELENGVCVCIPPDHGGCVDEYLQDQLIIFMALAAGEFERELPMGKTNLLMPLCWCSQGSPLFCLDRCLCKWFPMS